MKLTKEFIRNRINRLLITFKESWENIVIELDAGIMEINSWLSTNFPLVSEIITDESPEDTTYSYRAGGEDVPFFDNKYFLNIVIPFSAAEILSIDEEFGESFAKYKMQVEQNLFIMVRDEIHNVPYKFVQDHKGVYFADPDPEFKRNPEVFFNKRSKPEAPLLKIEYSWGSFQEHIPINSEAFISAPLPIDNNSYKPNTNAPIVRLSSNTHDTFIVDYNRQVLGIFIGWSLYNDNDINKIINKDYIQLEDQDVKLYAVFNLNVIGITYNGNGGTLSNWKPLYVSPHNYPSGQIIAPYGGEDTTNKKGHKFNGFAPPHIPVEFLLEYKDVVSEFEFRAKWEKETYKITYHYIENNISKTHQETYMYGSEENLMTHPIDETDPEAFIGWFDNIEGFGNPITKLNRTDYGDKVFYAKYSHETVIINWIVSRPSGTITIPKEYKLGQIIQSSEINSSDLSTYETQSIDDGYFYEYNFDKYVNDQGQEILFEVTIANSSFNIFASFKQGDPVNVNINVLVDDQGINNGKDFLGNHLVHKGIPSSELINYLSTKDDRPLKPIEYEQIADVWYYYSGMNSNLQLENNRIVGNGTTTPVYSFESKDFKGFKPSFEYTYTEQDFRNTLNWYGSDTGDYKESLNWKNESPVNDLNQHLLALNYRPSILDLKTVYLTSSNFQVGYLESHGFISKDSIINNGDVALNKNPITTINGIIVELMRYKVKNNLGNFVNLDNHLSLSEYDSIQEIEIIQEYEVQQMQTFNFRTFGIPIAIMKYEGEEIKTFLSTDLNHDNELEVNFNDYINNYYTPELTGQIFKGFKYNGIELEKLFENNYETEKFTLEDMGIDFQDLVIEPFVINIERHYVNKNYFNINYSVKVKREYPSKIEMYLNNEDRDLMELILNSYEEYIYENLDIQGLQDFSWNKENKTVVLFNEEKVENIGNQDFNQYPNFKNKISTGLLLSDYKQNDNVSDSYPVTVTLPNAEESLISVPVNINFNLSNEFGYKRIFISNRMIVENGNQIENISLKDIIPAERLKELYITVPTFISLIQSIDENILQGFTSIKLYDHNHNEITNSYITEDTYVIIRARRN